MTEKYENKYIREHYGTHILKNVRSFEEISRRYGRYCSHLHFNLQCKHQDVTPKSLRLTCVSESENARNIIKRAEKALLNDRISETVMKKKRLGQQKERLAETLQDTLTPNLYREVIEKNEARQQKEMKTSSQRQRNKYLRLKYGNNYQIENTRKGNRNQQGSHQQQQPTQGEEYRNKWVKNLSDRNLTDHEFTVLSKGGNFAIAPKKVPIDEYVAATEQACVLISNKGEKAALRGEISEILSSAKPPRSNLTYNERIALRDLRSDDSIVLLPADKGKCTVVMNKAEYVEKMEEKLKDENTYKRIHAYPTLTIQQTLTDQLKAIKEEGQLSNKEYLELSPTQTQIPRMYGHPKIYKPGYPLREIVDGTGGVVKQVDKFVANIIRQYIEPTEHLVKNSADFVDQTRDMRVGEDESLVSYDVTALVPKRTTERNDQHSTRETAKRQRFKKQNQTISSECDKTFQDMCREGIFRLRKETIPADKRFSNRSIDIRFRS